MVTLTFIISNTQYLIITVLFVLQYESDPEDEAVEAGEQLSK